MLVNHTNVIPKVETKLKTSSQPSFGAVNRFQTDTISFTSAKEDKGPQKLHVMKSIAEGIFNPIKDIVSAIIKAPLVTGLVVAATAATIYFLPIVGTALAVGVAAYGAYQLGSGLINGIKAAKAEKTAETKDYTKANQQFERVGEGVFDLALTLNAAIKGVKQVSNTIKAIGEASKTAAANNQVLTGPQKLYAILKQVQTEKAVASAPKKLETVYNRILQDGKDQYVLLKEAGKLKKSTKEMQAIIEKIANPEQKAKLIKLLDDLSSVTKHSPQADQISTAIREILNSEKITGTETARILEIIDASREQPAVLAVLKAAMKSGQGTMDDVAKALNKIIGANRYSDEAAEVVAAVDNHDNVL